MIQIDMKIPENCEECRMQTDYDYCSAMPKNFCGNTEDNGKPEWCPLKEVPVNGWWISVKDRMPEKAGKYLVVSKTALAEPPYVKTAWFLNSLRDNSQFKYEGEPNEPGFYNGDGEGDWVERYVTHWMALPEPPKEG